MANILEGVRSQISIARSASGVMWTSAPTTSEANTSMRRVTCDLNVQKETFQSNEIRADQQIADMRHGATQSTGTLNGELSPLTFQSLTEGVLRKNFANFTTATLAAAGAYTVSGNVGTFTVASTTGLQAGQVWKMPASGMSPTDDVNKRFLITEVTSSTVFKFVFINGSTPTATTVTSASITAVGKACYVPESSHLDYYYAIERVYTDASNKSELFYNVKPQNLQVTAPANAMATVSIPLIGTGFSKANSRQMATPSSATTSGIAAGSTGVLMVNGSTVATITSINFDINGNVAIADAVVGSTIRPDVFQGTLTATGTLSAHFDDTTAFTLRDAFLDETEVAITVVLPTSSSATADFVAYTFPRVKLSSADSTDAQGGLTRSFGFTALKNESSSSLTEFKTTVLIQDSQAA